MSTEVKIISAATQNKPAISGDYINLLYFILRIGQMVFILSEYSTSRYRRQLR